MQPFNHSQQLPFRYFDSDMAKKRPLVVSFRRIQKMTPNNLENNSETSVSICDIHRLDKKLKDNNDVKCGMSRYNSNPVRIAMQKKGQSCRSFTSNDKQKFQLDSLYDESFYDSKPSDKGCVFPKEKFYGNAKLLLTMNDGISRKTIIDSEKDSHSQLLAMKSKILHDFDSVHHLTDNDVTYNFGLPSKLIPEKGKQQVIKLTTANINKAEKNHKGDEEKEELSFDRRKIIHGLNSAMPKKTKNHRSKEATSDDETLNTMNCKRLEKLKSFSAPSVCALQKLEAFVEHEELEQIENGESSMKMKKFVSMLSIEGNWKWKLRETRSTTSTYVRYQNDFRV